ncbi:protein timeless isoform X2 [Tribolium madens]|uniref:protein timeless isoform X2 n=1 Tax=Tribolium madens TaxID=41895 RepID=UPI001CF7382E|nr:protein timeless isoform X2 [Tribolium madens]
MAHIHNMFASICVRNGDTLTINDNCYEILQEILRELLTEDSTLRTYRRAIGFGQNIKKDLIPLLTHLKDDAKESTKIIDTIIKILVNLTIPIEYLLPLEAMSQTDVGRHTIFELNKLLTSSKEAFTDSRSTKMIMDHVKFIVESDLEMNLEYCDSINNCLLLLRNILHIPEVRSVQNNTSSMQNQIIWNLFTQSIDKVIIYLISCPQKVYWGVTMVQLIALLYKDQHVGTLQKLLNLWLEASLSESSEDNESNTSPPEQGSDDSSPIITSDPTSDSSDGGGGNRNKTLQSTKKTLMMRGKSTETETSTSSGVSTAHNSIELDIPKGDKAPLNYKRECVSSQSEDFGYVTQVENQESISTSSNEEDQPQQKPVHQKPHTFQKSRYNTGKSRAATALDKKELRRKKLVKRSKTNTINMKGLLHHLPTDEDIANILKEFTVDFLLKGYGTLVQDLHSQFLTNIHLQIDTSHFFWLVTYFLKFATQLELDLEHVSPVLSHEILSYLVFQGVWIYEELEMSGKIPDFDLKPCLRRLHLVVTAIREFLQAVETYQKMIHLSEEDRLALVQLQNQITEMEDLRSLFLLLLRQYNPNIQSRQYLQDLILTNHNYLLFLDSATKERRSFNMMEHLKQFATVEIMKQYGLLLESFKENGEFVNNCIFTMMHHIGGDLEHVATLFQPSILKTFSLIWETDYEICDDWSDLIEYIIHKFINSPRSNSDLNSSETCHNLVVDEAEWTEEEKHNLLGYYNQSQFSNDTIANITKKYEKCGVRRKSQLSIIKQLLEQNIINESQYNDFIKVKQQPDHLKETKNITTNQIDFEEKTPIDEGIRLLREYLCKDNKTKFVLWLQKVLINTCYVKLALANPGEFNNDKALAQPVIYYFALLNLPIPVVPWTVDQTAILKYQSFVLLLHKLGFYLPIDTGKIFVTIPTFWNAEYVFSMVQQLGPIDPAKLNFDVAIFKGRNRREFFKQETTDCVNFIHTRKFSLSDAKETPTMVRYTPFGHPLSIAIPGLEELTCISPPPELSIVDNHVINGNMECSPIHSACETASIASDLTRMCVSDEEDKTILVIEQK